MKLYEIVPDLLRKVMIWVLLIVLFVDALATYILLTGKSGCLDRWEEADNRFEQVSTITETIFCRITAGVWMSRSSVVWGPFSIVWGLAIALMTAMLYKYRNRSDGFLFLAGTFLGGAYEYFCSVFTEMVFGTVFWDYSEIPFNLGGRINLLYCFFWGIAAVVWFKCCYPFISRMIEKLPVIFGKAATWVLI